MNRSNWLSPRSRTRRHRRASILVLACFLLVAAFGFLAFALDIGRIVTTEAELQNAADSAALSGARALNNSPAQARTAASNLASRNEAAGAPVSLNAAEDVEIGNWDEDTATFTVLSGAAESQGNAVRVTCLRTAARGNPLNLFFGAVLGKGQTDASAFAVAVVEPSICGLIIGLDKFDMSGSSHTNSYNSDNGAYDPASAGMKGHVCSNTEIKMSGSTAVNGDAHPGPGEIVNSSSSIGVLGEEVPLTEPIVLPPVDPGDAATNNDNDSIPLSDDGKDPLDGSGKFVLSGGDHVQLAPGTYYFNELSLSGGSSITITGPTVIYAVSKFKLSGGSVTNTTQLPKNLQIYCMGSEVNISGDSELYAAVYAPTAKVTRSGDSDFYGMVVGKELTLSGSGGIHVDEALDILDGTDGRVRLVQ